MYLRMLKKDVKDKIGLNIVLFVFMILASMFMAIGFVMLYSNLYGAKLSYELCNTSDIAIYVDREVDDVEKNRNNVKQLIDSISECERYTDREIVMFPASRIDYVGIEDELLPLRYELYCLTGMPSDMNVPYTIDDKPFYVENGHIAIAQHIAKKAGVGVGDKIRLTTQLGNIYEFEISVIYKDPSSEAVDMLIVSDGDRDLIFSECPDKYDLFELKFKDDIGNYDYENIVMDYGTKIIVFLEDARMSVELTKMLFTFDDGIMNLIVSVVMEVIAVFLIAMIFVTINFSLRSAIKREEKEIGVMKAMGVYSFSYRALFAVKYIAFAVVGGTIGLPLALVLSQKLINTFSLHIILPSALSQIILSVCAVLICALFIILFTFLSLRRMNKISVMDAIHGENRGERFKKLPGFMLYKRRSINVPMFMAISDILKRVKRYIYLVFAYVCGISMILLVIQIRDTICSVEYMQKYWQLGDIDFAVIPEADYIDKLVSKGGDETKAYDLINENLKEHGIPARIDIMGTAIVNTFINGNEYVYVMSSGDFDRDKLMITKGHTPKLYNEIAVPAFNAKRDNINIGDIVTIEYNKYTDDHTTYNKVKEEFIVTAFFEGMGIGVPVLFTGNDFEGAVYTGADYFNRTMDCSDKEYDMYFNMMDDLYTDDEIRFVHKDGVVDYFLGDWLETFNLLLLVVSVVIGIVLILLTVLYQNIFIEEETGDVALLRSMGFNRFTIKIWHFLRIMLLVLAAIIFAHILVGTAGKMIMQEICRAVLHIVEFKLITRMFSNLIVVPFVVLGLVAISLVPALKPMDSIQIWRIKND